jgi:branched-chain amino acid transport system substrate-binding protein
VNEEKPKPPPPKRNDALRWILLAIGIAAVVAIAWYIVARSSAPVGPLAVVPAPSPVAPAPGPRVRGVTDDEIKLGMVASFSGSNKERGRAMKIGWESALAVANEAGGVHGRKLRLLTMDDGYDPARTLPAMKQLVESDGVFAIVGNVGTATAGVAAPYCTEQKVPFFGPLTGADFLRKTPPDHWVFNVRASLAEEAGAAVRWLTEVKRIAPERIAVVAQEDDFGESGWRGAARELERLGVPSAKIVKAGYRRNTADVRAAIEVVRQKAGKLDAVILVATYKPAATFIRKAHDVRLEQQFVVVSADSNGLAQELVESGGRYADRVTVTQVVPVPTSKATAAIKYRDALAKHTPGEPPGSTTLEGWLGAQLFLEGLQRAGRDLDGEKLVRTFEGMSGLDLGIGAVLGFSTEEHQACKKVWAWQLQHDGTFTQIDLE